MSEMNTENMNKIHEGSDFPSTLEADIIYGIYSILYKRISNITINDARIKMAFQRFVKEVECGDTISIAELLYSSEALLKKGCPDINAGNEIFCFDDYHTSNKRFSAKLLKNSVLGVYSLFSLKNGVSLELNSIGDNISAAETKRFLILPPKKSAKFSKDAEAHGIKLVRVGEMLSTNRIIVTLNKNTVADIDKSKIDSSSESIAITLSKEHFAAYLSGYNVVSSIGLCNCISQNNLIKFGIGAEIETVFARALGYFAATMFLKLVSVRTVYTADNSAIVAVSRPNISDGDYLYLLKLRNDNDGLPDKGHYGQLYYYLTEKKRMGIIKDVLPVRENINRIIGRLCNDKIEYVPLSQMPEDCFGIIVSVGRGESVNGIKLGYFKSI